MVSGRRENGVATLRTPGCRAAILALELSSFTLCQWGVWGVSPQLEQTSQEL